MMTKALFVLCILTAAASVSAQKVQPDKPKFGEFQCRADAQKWTYDPFDKTLDPKFITGTAILVNGQFRVMPQLSYGVAVSDLLKRTYEMVVCKHEDEEFQTKYNTYALIEGQYRDERTFRYMNFLMKHDLEKQFIKEDMEEFK